MIGKGWTHQDAKDAVDVARKDPEEFEQKLLEDGSGRGTPRAETACGHSYGRYRGEVCHVEGSPKVKRQHAD